MSGMRMRETVPLDVAGFARSVLMEFLRPHVECKIVEEQVLVPPLGLAFSCEVAPSQDVFDELRMTPLALVVASAAGGFEPTRFTLNGYGKTMMESIRNALSQWVTGAAPILLAAFGEPGAYAPDVIVEETGAGADSSCWRMYLGQHTTGVIGLKGGSSLLSEQIEQHHLVTMLGPALKALLEIDPAVNTCWLKMALTRDASGAVSSECLLNEAPLEGGAEALLKFEWPEFEPTLAFIRQYAVFRRIPC